MVPGVQGKTWTGVGPRARESREVTTRSRLGRRFLGQVLFGADRPPETGRMFSYDNLYSFFSLIFIYLFSLFFFFFFNT